MDASHLVRAENKLSLGPVTSGDKRPSAPGARDRAVGVGGPSRAYGIKVPKGKDTKIFTGKPEGPR